MSKQHTPIKTKAKPLAQPEIKKNAGWNPYLVFTIFAFVLYSNTLNHSFALDDELVITNNVFTQQGVKGIPNIFKYDTFVGNTLHIFDNEKTAAQIQEEMKLVVGGRYRPLSLLTFALEIQFFGKASKYPNSGNQFIGNAFVSHLNNILLYLFTTCLLYLILCRLFPTKNLKIQKFKNLKDITVSAKPSPPIYEEGEGRWYLSFPFIVSLLFLAHPIHTEVVANIKGRDEIMTLLGALAALWFTIKYFDTNKIYNLLLSGLCLFLGLLSKENAITFLAVIPITIYYFVDKGINPLVKSMIPLIVASAVFLLIRATILGFANTSEIAVEILNNPFVNATKSETFATIFYTLLLYVKLLFFPHPLTFDYYPFHIEIVNWTNPVAILSLLFYLGIGAFAIYGFIKQTTVKSTNPQIHKLTNPQINKSTIIISYSIWFYLLPLSIVSNLFFPIGAFMGERFIFISSIGFSIFIGWLIIKFKNLTIQKFNDSRIQNYFMLSILLIILGLYSVKTISRNSVWKDNFTLLTTDVHTSKNSAKGNYMAAFEYMIKAIFPDNEDEIQRKEEFVPKADFHLKRAIELYPEYTEAFVRLGNLYFDCYFNIAKALHYWATALQHNTTRDVHIINMTKVLLNQTDKLLSENQVSSTPEEIIQSCNELLEAKPNFGEAYYIRGLMYGKYLNNMELALINFEKALSLDFEKTATFYKNAGVFYGISANYEKAIQCLLKAIELNDDPNDYITFRNLGIFYQKLGNTNNARLYAAKENEIKNRIQ